MKPIIWEPVVLEKPPTINIFSQLLFRFSSTGQTVENTVFSRDGHTEILMSLITSIIHHSEGEIFFSWSDEVSKQHQDYIPHCQLVNKSVITF